MPLVLTEKNCGGQSTLPLKKVNSHHGPYMEDPRLQKVDSTNP
jgi:hypothetical protein